MSETRPPVSPLIPISESASKGSALASPSGNSESAESREWRIDSALAAGRSGAELGSLHDGTGSDPEAPAMSHPFSTAEGERYVPIAELGRGGMGTVVSAVDLRLSRQVALKQVTQVARERPGMEQRLAREALITAALDHPGIVPIFDAGKNPDGSIYYTMRLVRGRALTDAIREAKTLGGRLVLLRHFLSACEAIAYAHSMGVIHRDVKPDNILVGEFGETQVADWGLARKLSEPDSALPEASPTQPQATAAGTVLGTPTYMSPEQATGGVVDLRSDVYALGVVLHEILCGVAPLHGKSAEEALAALRNGKNPDWLTKQKDAPAELVAIAEKAMRAEPEDRYPDARALALDVARYLDGRRVSAHHYSPKQEVLRLAKKWRVPLTVAAVFCVLLLVLGMWAIHRTRIERDAALAAEQRTRKALVAADESLAKSLLEQALDAQMVDAQPEAEILASHALSLAESPEARGVLARFSPANRPQLLAQQDSPSCAQRRIRDDGALLCINPGVLSVYSGTPLRPQWERKITGQDAIWFQKGKQIVVNQSGSYGVLLDAKDGTQLESFQGRFIGPRGLLGNSADTLGLLQHVDGLSVFSASPATIVNHVPCGGQGTHLASALSPQRARLATFCTDGSLAILDTTGQVEQRLANVFGNARPGASALALSPDGNHVAAAGLDGDLLIIDLKTQNKSLHRYQQGGVISSLSYSPDGRFLLLIGDRGGISIWNPDPGVAWRRFPIIGERSAHWSEDGTTLFTLGPQLRTWRIPTTLTPIHLTASSRPGLAGLAIAPAGDRVALARGDGHVDVIDLQSARLLVHDQFQTGVIKGVSFSPNGLLAWAAGSPSIRLYSNAGEALSTHDFTRLRRVALLPSGWLVTLCYAEGMRIIRMQSPTAQPRVIGKREFFDLDQSSDGKSLVAVDVDGNIWELRDHPDGPQGTALLQETGVNAVAISGDGRTIAVAKERSIKLIDVASRALIWEVASPGRMILDIKLSTDGRWLAAGDLDQAARVWSVSDGRLRAVMHGHTGRVSAVAFSPDGERLLTASWDGEPRVFGLETLVKSPTAMRHEIESAWGLNINLVHRRHVQVGLP